MSGDALLADIRRELAKSGVEEVELFLKEGRSRRLEIGPEGRRATVSREAGWAVRASDRRSSFFAAGTGRPDPAGPWPAADGRPLRLPDPGRVAPWSPPDDLDEPLASEAEQAALIEALDRTLGEELPGARLLSAHVEDGGSRSWIASSRGIRAESRSRATVLWAEAVAPDGRRRASLHLAERAIARLAPQRSGRLLADRLAVLVEGREPARDRGEFVLAPPLAVRLLEALLPLFVGAAAADRIADFVDRRGKVAGSAVTVVDDGRLAGGVLAAPVDGEGVATRETVIVEAGSFRQPLVAWHEARPPETRAAGCSSRRSWRDLPRPGPTHLYVRPDPDVSPAALLASVARGYYLLDATGPPRFDLEADRISVPVCGFALRAGRAVSPVSGAMLRGSAGSFLQRIQAVGRDLALVPARGILGAPSLLVTGLELVPAP